MSNHNTERNNPKTHKNLGNPPRHPGSFRKKDSEVFIGNLPLDVKEMEMVLLLKEFGVKSVKKCMSLCSSFVFLELASPEAVQLAVQCLNGSLVRGRRITVAVAEDRRPHEPAKINTGMPDLELVLCEELGLNSDPVPKADTQILTPSKQKALYAVPIEMRTSFLVHMLKDCFQEVSWLLSIAKVTGKVGLLVMDTIPQSPYFWAIHLTKECHQNMQKLFTALAEVESQVPFLIKQDVHQGTRCLAECVVGNEGNAWNRCWVLEKAEDLAMVFFVDFGHSATVPLNSLRKLDRDEFWKIKPLAQPFALQEGVFPPQVMMRQILEGKVVGQLQREPHILKFALEAN
ncbi:tudor domain-containing protein 10 isoform X2 [Rhineura floridana]|nr:tudor domain-containing protein 10 isoform X2 [Rhineura floridana]